MYNLRFIKYILVWLCYSLILLFSYSPRAAQDDDRVEFSITAMVLEEAQCMVNNNENIVVQFGDVDITKIDGSSYLRKQLDLHLTCEHLQNNQLTLQVYGASAQFNTALLAVPEKPGLGVRLLNNGTPQAINEDFTLNYGDNTILEAVLDKDVDATLMGGEFTASATLRVTYQ